MKKLIMVALVAMFTISVSFVMAQPPRGGQRQQPTPEQRVEMMAKQLDLSEEQCDAILKIEKSQPEMKKGDREAMKKAREEQSKAIKKVLTKEQAKKWDKVMAKQRQNGNRRPM